MTAEELGVKEKVRFTVLKEIIESGVQGEELKKVFKSRHIDLIPKTSSLTICSLPSATCST